MGIDINKKSDSKIVGANLLLDVTQLLYSPMERGC